MRMIYTLLLIILCSCATSGNKQEKELSQINNKDFDKIKSQKYNSQKDFFKMEEKESFVLADEALLSSESVDKLKKATVMDKILGLCLDKNYQEAFKLIEENTDAYKTHPVYWNQVGTCFLIKKEYRKALMYFNKALEFKSNYAPALNNIGVMYRKQGEDQKAQVAFEKATKSSVYAKTPRYNLAQIYLEYGLSGNAQKHLNVLLRESPDDTVYNSLAVSYLMENDFKKALIFYKKINIDQFEKPSFGINYALTLFRSGNRDKAIDIINDVELEEKSKYKNYYKKIRQEVR